MCLCLLRWKDASKICKDGCLWGESLPEGKEGGIPAYSLLGLWKQLRRKHREAWHTAQWQALA